MSGSSNEEILCLYVPKDATNVIMSLIRNQTEVFKF